MTKPMRVLVFPAGSEIAAEVHSALRWLKDVELFGAASMADHSEALFRHLVTDLPYLGQAGLIERLNSVIDQWQIDYIWPARDDVQLFLAQHADELGCELVSAPLPTVETLRSKRATYEALSDESFVPHTFRDPHESDLPLFAKPSVGEGSKGATLVEDLAAAREFAANDSYVLCEYLPGVAYTVDCLTGLDGELLCCSPRTRDRVKSGISVRSETVADEVVRARVSEIAKRINQRFDFVGAWFFQLKERADGSLVLMEASPRVPGTMGLTRNLGVNYPILTLYTMRGMRVSAKPLKAQGVVERAFISRYRLGVEYESVYIDYDDTLVVRGETNPLAMAFLYQCKNQGKRVHLLTRHDDEAFGALREDMARRGIAEGLFDTVMHLGRDDRKSSHVTEPNAIFIDDSFRERCDVADRCGVPTFDVSSIEALLDWRA